MIKWKIIKTIITLFIFGIYTLGVINLFWINADSPEEVERIQRYTGLVTELSCYSGRKSFKIYLKVALNTGNTLDFRYLGVNSCDAFEKEIVNPIGMKFDGYFIGAGIMSLKIGDIVLVDYDEEKERKQGMVRFLLVWPILCLGIILFMRRKKSN